MEVHRPTRAPAGGQDGTPWVPGPANTVPTCTRADQVKEDITSNTLLGLYVVPTCTSQLRMRWQKEENNRDADSTTHKSIPKEEPGAIQAARRIHPCTRAHAY